MTTHPPFPAQQSTATSVAVLDPINMGLAINRGLIINMGFTKTYVLG